ncbi:MAG: RnfABCDGE type electron transport complex subunit G [Nitrospirae bacterium]|nr:RnfABCDGE type electron transport complex subunit G [Nitrospirota bacterium]
MLKIVKDAFKMGVILLIICVIAAGALAQVYSITKVIIDKNEAEAEKKKRQDVLPAAARFEEKDIQGKKYIIGYNAEDKQVGGIFKAAPRGYSGPIRITVGVAPDNSVSAVVITKLDQTETPGLGTNITKPKFLNQFKGKKGNELKLKKDSGAIDAITAATISSRAVANGVKGGWEQYIKDIGESK